MPDGSLASTSLINFVDSSGKVSEVDFEALTRCRFAAGLLMSEEVRASVHLWAMPPPCSPTRPFGPVPSAEAMGCVQELASQRWPLADMVEVRLVNEVVGLGVFANTALRAGACLFEYAGELLVDVPSHVLAEDDYAASLPVCDPQVVVSARWVGGLARLLNHDETPNCELRTIHHEGTLHLICVTKQHVEAGDRSVAARLEHCIPLWSSNAASFVWPLSLLQLYRLCGLPRSIPTVGAPLRRRSTPAGSTELLLHYGNPYWQQNPRRKEQRQVLR